GSAVDGPLHSAWPPQWSERPRADHSGLAACRLSHRWGSIRSSGASGRAAGDRLTGQWSGPYRSAMNGSGFEELSRAHERTKADLARATRELRELIGIGVRLAAERDTEALLELILTTARDITWSEAGSLYLMDTDGAGTRCLRSALVQNDSLPVAVKELLIPIDQQSVPGYAALSGEVINLPDAYYPPAGSPFTVTHAI